MNTKKTESKNPVCGMSVATGTTPEAMERNIRQFEPTTMKFITTIKSSFRVIAVAAFAAGFATSASAQRANATISTEVPLKAASTQEEIMGMKKGDHYAKVCMECKSITVRKVADEKEVAGLCHNGASIDCPSCKKKFTVRSVGPRPGGPIVATSTIVNGDGRECMFIVPLKQV